MENSFMMYRQFFLLAVAFLLISCSSIERDNPNDPNSNKYRGWQVVEPPAGGSSSGSAVVISNCPLNGETVTIGTQVWMKENLNCNVSGSKCYNNDLANCQKYGRLYNWETAMKVCPNGWHLPSDFEWNILINFFNPSCRKITDYITDCWGTDLMNPSGFAALLGGYCQDYGGEYRGIGKENFWWSATVFSSSVNTAFGIYIEDYTNIRRDFFDMKDFFSVRCVKD